MFIYLFFISALPGSGSYSGAKHAMQVIDTLLFTSAAYVQVHFILEFVMEANNMNPDQTAPKGR